MTEEESVRQQLQNLQTDLLEKFEELKSDNEKFKLRLQRIEEKLGIGVEIQPETSNVDDIEEEQEKQEKVENEVEVVEGANIDNEEEDYDDELGDEEEEEDNDDEGKPEVKLEKLPTSTFKGFCFRPLAGWRNSSGRLEISKEWVSVNEDEIELKICGFESGEEIAKILIPLKDIEKVEASFDEKTVLFLFVERDICEAATQSLAMTNISSFSLVDKDARKIRICFEKITDQRKALLREYFRRNAIFFRFMSTSTQDRIFFKPIRKPTQAKYDSNKPLPLDDFVKTVNTIKFLDRVTYTCKVCDYYNENKDIVIRHVNKYHIEVRKSIPDKDVLVQYIKCN